jgi:AcrR family transcriptional regulator
VTAAASPAASTLLARAFDPSVQPPDDPTSDAILDAAVALAAASGLRNLTMDDVARKARVGRMTVYRRFGDRPSLVEAMVVREARRFLVELDHAVSRDAPAIDQLADGFVVSLTLARSHPLIGRLTALEPESLLEALNADDGLVLRIAREYLVGRAQSAGIAGPDAAEVAEVLARLGASFLLLPHTLFPLDDEQRLRRLAIRVLAPVAGIAPRVC